MLNGFNTIQSDALIEFERATGEFELPTIGHTLKAQKRGRVLHAFNRLKELSLIDSLTETEIAIALSCGAELPPKPARRRNLKNVKRKSYGPPRYSDEQPMDLPTRIPPGSTHLKFQNSRVEIIAPINTLEDYRRLRGKLTFGILNRLENWRELNEDGKVVEPESEPLAPDVIPPNYPEEKRERIILKKPAPPPGRGKVEPAVFGKPEKAASKPVPAFKAAPIKSAPGKSLRPGSADSKTGQVWTIADKLKAKGGDVTKDAVLAIALKAGLNPDMVGVQFSRWKKEN